MRRAITLTAVVCAGGYILWWWAMGAATPAGVPTGSDSDDIQALIEGAITTYETACLVSNHGSEQVYKQQLASYWSTEGPDATELARAQDRLDRYRATPNPTFVTSYAATLIAEGSYGAGTAEAVLQYQHPTPNWSLGDTPLDFEESRIDRCQSVYGIPGQQAISFQLTDIAYRSIVVEGDSATVDATVTLSKIYSDGGSGTTTYDMSNEVSYDLVRENGDWRIRAGGVKPSW